MSEKPFTRQTYEAFLAEGRLMGAQSASTGKIYVPPRPLDPETHEADMSWVELSGRGKLVAFTSIFIGTTAMINAGYDRRNPYLTGIVELEEGPHISAQILGVNAAHPSIQAIGTPLQVTFIIRGEGEETETMLAFQPETA